ncbi:integrase-recombinase protein [Rhodopirellula islandica]|uniref:Integrase-recombinase protein n=1 Tax=Rhodopirellula islandica TaxID=595434 RepID=A0A0J1BH80_RHOIS|nr:integrase-recombinase protein [Rhodopirellula islandica]
MGFLFKKVVTRPMPAGATLVTRKGKPVAQWTDRRGKKRSAEVTNGKDGKPRIKTEAGKWIAKYRDGEGCVQEITTGCSDKQAAMAVLNELTTRAEHVKSKILSPDQDRIADHAGTPIGEHIEAFLEYQRQKGTHPDRVKGYKTKLYETAGDCNFRTLPELSVDRLERWLSEQCNGDRDMSASLYNSYREAWLAFGNWCIGKRQNRKQTHFNGDKRLIANPFEGMTKLNDRADRRREARALTEAELVKLLEAARTRPLIHAQTIYRGKNKGKLLAKVSDGRRRELKRLGRERALIYKTLVLTGLRANELRTLTVGDLLFNEVPSIKLKHDNEKNRAGSEIALRLDLAADLRKWTQGRDRSERVFTVPDGILKILNRDLEAAGIEKTVDDRVVHVHALRHSFGTHLSLAGVAPRVAQAAMRHSNISLTMGTYTDAKLLDTATAVEALPSLPIADDDTDTAEEPKSVNASGADRSGKTGETKAETPPRTVAPLVAPDAVQEGQNMPFLSLPDQTGDGRTEQSEHEKTPQNTGLCGVFDDGRYRTRICDLHDVNVAL